MNKFLIAIFLLTGILLSQSRSKYEWQKIAKIANEPIRFFTLTDEKNFSVVNYHGDLWFFNGSTVKKVSSPVPLRYRYIAIENLGKNNAVLMAMGRKWETHFYFLKNGKWKESDFRFEFPLKKIVVLNRSTFYACGNFGSLVKFQNGRWKKFHLPIKGHINYIQKISLNAVLFLSSLEGLYLFKDEKLTKIKSDVSWSKHARLFKEGNDFYVNAGGNFNYRLVRDTLVQVREEEIFKKFSKDEFGQITGNFFSKKGKKLKVEFPPEYKFTDFRMLQGNRILFADSKGEILLATTTRKNFFSEKARNYSLQGTPNAYNLKGVVKDFNNDSYPDVLLFSQGNRQQIDLLINGVDRPFLLRPDVLKLNKESSIAQILSADFNNDLENDVLILYYSQKQPFAEIYKNKNLTFKKIAEIPLPKKLASYFRISLLPADLDADGDLDLVVTSYYGEKDKPGSVFFFFNKMYGHSWELDTISIKGCSGWNSKTIWADFDNNGLNDLLVANKWRKSKLFMLYEGGFVEESGKRFEKNVPYEDHSVVAADIDNDGDLDILFSRDQSRLQILKNNGSGYFHDVTDKMLRDNIEFSQRTGEITLLHTGDFNNDNYPDVLLTSYSENRPVILLINDAGKSFYSATKEFKLTQGMKGLKYLLGDVNRDGDLDLLELRFDGHKFWESNAANENFIQVKTIGVNSNSNGIGAKVYLYNNDSLVAFRQIGADGIDYDVQSSSVVNFGAEAGKSYDVIVKFYGGGTVLKKDVRGGTFLTVEEAGGMQKTFLLLPSLIFDVASNSEIQSYVLVVFLFTLVIVLGIRLSQNKYKWGWQFSAILISVNLSLSWILVLINSSASNVLLKYFLPIFSAVVGVLIPNALFYLLRDKLKTKNIEETEEELLQLLISFSHGEWALRNLNSLQLFFSNFSSSSRQSENLKNQMKSRINTFLELTKKNLKKIIVLSEEIELFKTKSFELKEAFETTDLFLKRFDSSKDFEEIKEVDFKKCAEEIARIKLALSELRNLVYARFSCDVSKVIKKLAELYAQEFKSEKIDFKFEVLSQKLIALIKADELMAALDNLMMNSIRALKNRLEKKIEIKITYRVPKINISFYDNGAGVESEIKEKIFERGFSLHKSTGEGLYNVKKTLQKYGGQIYLTQNFEKRGTIFTLEFNLGRAYETAIVNN